MADRQTLVQKLARFGFSHVKALEIAIDYERGDTWAREWIAHVDAWDGKTTE